MPTPSPSRSNPATPNLASTQQWMMAAITAPGGLPQGLVHAQQACGWQIDDVVMAPPGISPHARLNIYAQGYWLRLFACLKADYPALLRLLGEPLFEFFARAYLDHHPSRSFSLYDLGCGFAAFLRRSQSAATKAANDGTLNFPIDLARIELAFAASQRASGLEGEVCEAIDPLHLLLGGGINIELPATTRLVLTHYPLSAFQPWLNGDTASEPPEKHIAYIAIKRQRYRVSYEALADWQFYFLAAARRRKRPLQACAEAAARRTQRPTSELLAKLAFWLAAAQAGGMVKMTL
ncbi:MAG: hypothetical protein FD135_3269 [Comamonadaceae bacterium]|nr:MAG: hypothetical protein FD135_3269 [Comamonadaceae bacterium]